MTVMADVMNFPKRWEDFLHDYEFEDARRIYTNGSRLIPSFRVKQMMEHYAPVRHGRWIFGKDLPYSWGQIIKNKCHLYCSECLEQAFNRSEDNDPDFDVDTPYCPVCGCCMDGGDE